MERIKRAMANQPVFPLARGELWLGSQLLQQAGYTDTLENHVRLAQQLGQDLVCLPVTDDITDKPDLGYRYFSTRDLGKGVAMGGWFIAAVVDGPFQSMVNQMGLMAVLTAWVRQRQEIARVYADMQAETLELIRRCLDQGVHAVVMADDLAADRAPLISPKDIDALCTCFYDQAAKIIHGAGALALLHSCGNITTLIPLIKTWKLDGLAAVQQRANDLVALHAAFDGQMTIMAGIESELLESDSPPSTGLETFKQTVQLLGEKGGLILSSCCGLYRGDFLDRLRRIYALTDTLLPAGDR